METNGTDNNIPMNKNAESEDNVQKQQKTHIDSSIDGNRKDQQKVETSAITKFSAVPNEHNKKQQQNESKSTTSNEQQQHNRDGGTPVTENNEEDSEPVDNNETEDNTIDEDNDSNLDPEKQQQQQPQVNKHPPPSLQHPSAPSTPTISAMFSKLKMEMQVHHLKSRWTFWYLNPKKDMDWLDRLKDVSTIDSVEQFWALYDNIRPPSGLQSGSDYSFFKESIQPVWECADNKSGGRLFLMVDKGKNEILDHLWLELLLTLIGEQFGEDSDHICGAVCNFRQKGHKICLWTKDAEAEEVNRRIGQIMKNRFQSVMQNNGINLQIRVHYEEHNAGQQKMSSALNSRFTLT